MRKLIVLITLFLGANIFAAEIETAANTTSESRYVPSTETVATFYPNDIYNTVKTVTFTSPTRKILLHFNLTATYSIYVPITVTAYANDAAATGQSTSNVYYASKYTNSYPFVAKDYSSSGYTWTITFRLDDIDFEGDKIEIVAERTGEDS